MSDIIILQNIQGCLKVSENESWQAFHKAEYQILSFPRTLSDELTNDINLLCESDALPDLRTSGSLAELKEILNLHLTQHPKLFADVWLLADRFARLSECEELKIFLGFVRTDMCRRFHADVNVQRLLCTYSGAGTLWVPHAALNAEALREGTNDEIVRSPKEVQQAKEGEVLILKGALHPRSELGAACHRSPGLTSEGEKRLLLRIDTPGFLA